MQDPAEQPLARDNNSVQYLRPAPGHRGHSQHEAGGLSREDPASIYFVQQSGAGMLLTTLPVVSEQPGLNPSLTHQQHPFSFALPAGALLPSCTPPIPVPDEGLSD